MLTKQSLYNYLHAIFYFFCLLNAVFGAPNGPFQNVSFFLIRVSLMMMMMMMMTMMMTLIITIDNNKYSYKIARQCKSNGIKGVLSK